MLFMDIVGLVQDYSISSVTKMEGGTGPKLAKFESESSAISEKMFNFQRQLAEIEEHCKLFKSSLNSITSKNTEAIRKEDREKADEMQMSSYTGRPIQDYYCITQGVWERDGVSDANRQAEEHHPKVHIISPSSSSSDDATSLKEKSEKLTLFINPLSDIGERGTLEDNLIKTCEWESGRRRSEILRKSEDYLGVSAMAEEGDSAIGTPHPYLQRTTSFTFPDFYSPEESCDLLQTSRDKVSFPLESQMGKVHIRVSNSDSQGEDFWEFDTCTSDLGSVSMGTSPSSADSHSPHFGNSTVAFRKSPLNVMTSLGRSKSDRFLNVENWSLEPNSRTSSTSVDQNFDLKEMKSGEQSQREVTPQKSPEMTVFPDQKIELHAGVNFRENTPLGNLKDGVESDPCTGEDTSSNNGEQLTLYVPVVSSDSETIEEHESVILSISPSDKSEKNEILQRPVKKAWHQCVKDIVVNAVKSIFCAAEEDHDLEDLDMQTVRYKPEGLDTLCRATKFNRKELQLMYRGFKQECPSGVVNEETFKNIYSQFFPQGDSSRYAHFVFNSFDTDHNGSLTFEEFVSGLSILARGTVNEKLNWAFNLYDINGDGYITREEMLSVVQAIYDMMGKYSEPTAEDITPGEHVERVFQKMDINRDGVVSIEEFIDCCKKDETITRSMHVFDTIL